MSDQERILEFLQTNGPTLPFKIAKLLNTQILLASAHLSDLAAQGKLKISHLKIGGSPLYYLKGQEEQLYPFAAGNINPKDFQVLEKIKQEKVLREADLDLLQRVALRSLKDFAVPLQVSAQGKSELFWKWSLLSSEETNQYIGEQLKKLSAAGPLEVPASLLSTSLSTPSSLATTSTVPLAVEPSPLQRESPLEQQKTLLTPVKENIPSTPVKEPSPKSKVLSRKKESTDKFLPQIEEFCRGLKIIIEQKELLRKNAEINLLLKVPSIVGTITYFGKAKNKNKCDEKDLSTAYMEAQVKKLPLLFLYPFELSKKAQELVNSGAFENLLVKKLD